MPGGAPGKSEFWEQQCQTSDTDATIAGWGYAPLWSAAHPDDTPPAQQENHE